MTRARGRPTQACRKSAVRAWPGPRQVIKGGTAARHARGGGPFSVIGRASPSPKAPTSRCAHLGKPTFVHSEPLVQAPGVSQFFVQGTAGGPWKVCPKLMRQKPQKVRSVARL